MVDAGDEIDIIYNAYKHILKQTINDDKYIIMVINKADRLDTEELRNKFSTNKFSFLRKKDKRVIISAKDQKLVHKLAGKLAQVIKPETHGENDIIITNSRHYEALVNTGEALLRVKKGMKQDISNDLLAQDIREALHWLGEITGDITTDKILGNIFKNFCIGK
jgi:tRNA modification GTPase